VLGLRPLRVSEAARAAYHGGAVLSASGLVALLDAAVEAWAAAGVEREEALAALAALMRSALAAAEDRGTLAALMGPVVRGDAEVIQAHLRALPPDVLPLYRTLESRVLARVRPLLSRPAAVRLSAVLGPEPSRGRRPRRR
jgi:predicted short-subunit dehydrogenase-like oxidoreductase (DUF2520 family)